MIDYIYNDLLIHEVHTQLIFNKLFLNMKMYVYKNIWETYLWNMSNMYIFIHHLHAYVSSCKIKKNLKYTSYLSCCELCK